MKEMGRIGVLFIVGVIAIDLGYRWHHPVWDNPITARQIWLDVKDPWLNEWITAWRVKAEADEELKARLPAWLYACLSEKQKDWLTDRMHPEIPHLSQFSATTLAAALKGLH